MDMLLAFRGVHGGAANAARTAGIMTYFYDLAAILVLIFLVIVFLAILGLCVKLFRSWRTDPSEQGRQSGRILLIILVVLSGMSYVDYNYTNLLGGLCKEAVKGPKVRGIRANRGNATNIGGHWVHGFPKVRRQFKFVARLEQLRDDLKNAKPADIPELQGRLNRIENELIAANKGKSFSRDTQAFFKKLREDINGKYTLEAVQEAQEAQLRARAAGQAGRELLEKYRPAFDAVMRRQKAEGGPFTKEEMDELVRLHREIGWTEENIPSYIDEFREAGLLPEGYQIPPKDVPPAAPPAHLPADTPPPPEGAGVSILPRKPGTDPASEAKAMEKAYWRVFCTQGREAADAWVARYGFKLSRKRVNDLLKANEKAGANTETLDNIVNGLERRGLLPDGYGEIAGDYWIAPGLRAPSKGPAAALTEPARVPLFPWLDFELFPVSVRGVADYGVSAMRDASHAGWNGIYSLLQKNRPWVMRELGGSHMPRNVIYRDGKPYAPTTTGSYILHTDDGIQLVSPFKPGSPVPSAWDLRDVKIPEHSWFSGRGNLVWPAPEGSAAGQLVYGPLGRIGRVTAEGTVESFSPVSASIPKEVVNGDIVQFNNGATAQYVVPETGPPYLQPVVGKAKWIQNPEGAFTTAGSSTDFPANSSTIVYNPEAPDDPLWNFFTYKIFSGKDGRPYAPMTEDQAVRLQQADVDLSRAANTPYTLEVTLPSVLRRWFDPGAKVSTSGNEELGTALTRNHGKAYGPQRSGLPEERLSPYAPSISPPSRPIIVPHPQSTSPSPRVWSLPRQVFPPVYEGLRWLGVPGRSLTIQPVDKILWSVLPKSWQKYRPSQIAKTRLNAQASAFQKGVATAVNTGATGLTLGALYAAADPMGRMYWHGKMAIQDPELREKHTRDALVAAGDTIAAGLGFDSEAVSTHVPTHSKRPTHQPVPTLSAQPGTNPSSLKADTTTAASTPTVDPTADNPNISAQTPSSWVVPGALLGGLVGGAFGGLTARGETEEERRRNRAKGFALGGIGGTILGGLGGYAADQYQA